MVNSVYFLYTLRTLGASIHVKPIRSTVEDCFALPTLSTPNHCILLASVLTRSDALGFICNATAYLQMNI